MKPWMLAILVTLSGVSAAGTDAFAGPEKARQGRLAKADGKKAKGKKGKKAKGAAAPAEAPKGDAANKPGRGGPSAGLGLLALFGYESIDFKDAEVGIDGFALVVGPMYHLAASPEIGVSAGAAFHYASLAGTSDIATYSVTPMTLTLLANGNYFFAPDMAVGLGFGYDLFTIGGTAKFEVDDLSLSNDIEAYSRTELLARFIYMSSKTLAINGEFGTVSGSMTVKSDEGSGDPASFSGMTLRGGVTLHF